MRAAIKYNRLECLISSTHFLFEKKIESTNGDCTDNKLETIKKMEVIDYKIN